MNPESLEGNSSLADEAVVDSIAKELDEGKLEYVATDEGEADSVGPTEAATEASLEVPTSVDASKAMESIEATTSTEAHTEKVVTIDGDKAVELVAESAEREESRADPVLVAIVSDDLVAEAEEGEASLAAPVSDTLGEDEGASLPQSIAPAATAKKFTSLNVNKRFLEKASPTLAAIPSPVVAKASSAQPPSRLSTISPASRLMSAKLTSIKPQPAGWGQLGTSSNPSSPGVDPLPALSATSSIAAALGSAAPASSKSVAASPKLVTALTSGSINRSTSPHNKGSPGLRNAALSSSGRTASPSVSISTTSTSNKAPWAKIRADAASAKLSSDFPTAAEAARAKQEAERKEKQAAAEAAAKAEQALQYLDSFRGASLGIGNHWDEMDDEDDMDEVVQFGDGTQYKVPVEAKEEPVTKEERFKDVGHDRSWPPRADEVRSPPIARTSSIREQTSMLSPSSTDVPTPRLFNSRAVATKVEIRGVEGISLETEALDRGFSSQREGKPFYRSRDQDGPGHHATSASSTAATAAAPARAWGPLAQRQASLNPDAPKSAVLSPPSVPKPASTLSPTKEKSQEKTSAPLPLKIPPPSATSVSAPPIKSTERALPPHLAASQAAAQKIAPLPSTNQEVKSPIEAPHATPYGARFGQGASTITSEPPVALPIIEEQQMNNVVNQREEMLSAAERARKRRQEEEEKRLAEKERAKAKAAAIEEKMRFAEEEQKRKEEEAKRKEEVDRQERIKAEEANKKAASDQAAERWRARNEKPDVASVAVAPVLAVPAVLSPGDEATSWRRNNSKAAVVVPLSPVAAESPERVTVLQRAQLAPTVKQNIARPTKQSTTNEYDLATSTGMEGWDVVINRIKDAIPASKNGEPPIPTGPRLGSRPMQAETTTQVRLPGKTPRVEIIAPNDAGAARQREVEQQKQKEGRYTQGSNAIPISVLKSKAIMSAAEPPTTSNEVVFDAPPVWNKYKIKIGPSTPPVRLARHLIKAQAIRVANFKNEVSHSKPPNLLTWDPPILNLSTRTLSRDDLFFPKKYRKGTVITNVTIPTIRLKRLSKASTLPQRDVVPVVKMPPSTTSLSSVKAVTSPQVSITGPSHVPASMRGKTIVEVGRDTNSPVAFAQSIRPKDTSPSPVSFMVTSEVDGMKDSQNILAATPVLATSSSILPSPNPMAASTWGQSSLTFTSGLDQPLTAADPNHLREVWALPSTENTSMQNSLRGFVDEELPDVPAQYHEVGINTSENHHSAPISRVYSPLTSNDKQSTDTSNGFTSLTSASTPSTAKSSPQNRLTTSNGYSPSMIKSSFKDPRPSNAFSPYAFPNPLQEFGGPVDAAFFPMQHQSHQQHRSFAPQSQQQYGQLDADYNTAVAAGGGNAARYRGGHMAMMSNTSAPWSIDNASYGMPRQTPNSHHHSGSGYLASPQQIHQHRTSSTGNMRASYNSHQNNNNYSRGGAGSNSSSNNNNNNNNNNTMRTFRGGNNVDNVW